MARSAKEIQRDHQRLLDNIRLLQSIHGIEVLRSAVGVSKSTWILRMKEPWRTFSYDDFRLISSTCKVDFTALVEGTLSIS